MGIGKTKGATRRWAVTLRAALLAACMALLAACTAPVRVEWSTEVEMNTAGFDLYRAESPDGPFDYKVNDAPIPASPDPLAGGQYSYVDRTTKAGRTYYYQLHEIELGGHVNVYGPIEVRATLVDTQWVVAAGAVVLAAGLLGWWLGRRRRTSAGKGDADGKQPA
ncbi:MAG: hypothetical protein NZ528_08760 [Caldilineales bacterium]|nr:hypothetical protein [Caldilineales bacterium]MDW8317991.1 hypothetical protein [Anaerolineae bacterium]